MHNRLHVASTACAAMLLGVLLTAPWACAGHLEDVQQQLTAQRENWQSAGIDDYRFRFQRICFCLPAATKAGIVTVLGGNIASVHDTSTGDLLDPTFFLTVDELFAELQSAVDSHAAEVVVEYDDVWGFPSAVDIDFISQAIDDEVSFRAAALTPIPEPSGIMLCLLGLASLLAYRRRGRLSYSSGKQSCHGRT